MHPGCQGYDYGDKLSNYYLLQEMCVLAKIGPFKSSQQVKSGPASTDLVTTGNHGQDGSNCMTSASA